MKRLAVYAVVALLTCFDPLSFTPSRSVAPAAQVQSSRAAPSSTTAAEPLEEGEFKKFLTLPCPVRMANEAVAYLPLFLMSPSGFSGTAMKGRLRYSSPTSRP